MLYTFIQLDFFKYIFLLLVICAFSSCVLLPPDKRKAVKRHNLPDVDEPSEIFERTFDFKNTIKPNHISQKKMDKAVAKYYEYWFNAHLGVSNGVTPGGGYYIYMQGTGGTGNEITTSEAHGYGMLIFALMGNQHYFDGMFNMYDKHRSTGNPHLMSWLIDNSESKEGDDCSATDGDMDIAYALIMAHDQWGSEGAIDYLGHAKRLIQLGIKKSEMSADSKRTLLGDWDSDQYSTRASDWMTGHMHAYSIVTGDPFWNDAADTAYEMIRFLSSNYSPKTGLMPDFIVGAAPKPAPEYFLNEYRETDEYNWNSCRWPWRMAVDYAHYGTPEAKKALNKTLSWLKTETKGKPENIVAGYQLNGAPLAGATYFSAAFTAPFVAAATVDSAHQDFLNAGWDRLEEHHEGYYSDSINLLCLIFISGNWWKPGELK